jgi:hypothetical protein
MRSCEEFGIKIRVNYFQCFGQQPLPLPVPGSVQVLTFSSSLMGKSSSWLNNKVVKDSEF